MTEDKTGDWDGLLIDKDEISEADTHKYIKPNIEHKLPAKKRNECRDILLEIKKFGVSQRQMLYLIYLMALELEDVEAMRAITAAVGEHREKTPIESIELNTPSRILLTDG